MTSPGSIRWVFPERGRGVRSQEMFDVLGSPRGRAEADGWLVLGDFSGVEKLSRRVAWETAAPYGHHAHQCAELAVFDFCV